MRYLARIAAFAGVLFWAHAAGAVTITIGAQPNGTGAITSLASGSGSATYAGTTAYGNIIVASANGTGNPPLPVPSLLDSNTIDISSTAAGSVYVYVTASDISSPTGPVAFLTSFTANGPGGVALPAGWNVVLQSYVDTSNAIPSTGITGTLLAQECFGGAACGTVPTSAVNVGSGPYSVTALYKITTSGAGSANLTIDIAASPVPLPQGLPLLATTLVGLAFLGWKRRAGATAA